MYNIHVMIRGFFRLLWRVVILLFGTLLIWVALFKIFPYAEVRMPAFFVLVLIYAAFAYAIIPALIRIFRIFSTSNHIPLYAITPDGLPSDPVNIAVVSSNREQLIDAMGRAGWCVADVPTPKNMLRFIYAILLNRPYPTAPFSNLYLFGRPFDIGFQKPANHGTSPRSRHHVRFWRLEIPKTHKHTSHFHFWHSKLEHLLGIEDEVWIGAAIEDIGLGISRKTAALTHQVSSNTDAERDLIVTDLQDAKQAKKVNIIEAGETFSFRGHTIWMDGPLICDGSLTVVELKGRMRRAVLKRITKK